MYSFDGRKFLLRPDLILAQSQQNGVTRCAAAAGACA
jgi:hypothetical protein